MLQKVVNTALVQDGESVIYVALPDLRLVGVVAIGCSSNTITWAIHSYTFLLFIDRAIISEVCGSQYEI